MIRPLHFSDPVEEALPTAAVAKPRTPAQQEASRRNGSRSHGPVTLQGKARSRANALKHGLLARQITPPGDPREHDQVFQQLCAELAEEFAPATFTQRATVTMLAHE